MKYFNVFNILKRSSFYICLVMFLVNSNLYYHHYLKAKKLIFNELIRSVIAKLITGCNISKQYFTSIVGFFVMSNNVNDSC